jgi:3-hydroxyisobutyrate dehydrogenase-like beta-hydroxyacid dehydrogenase
LIELDDAVHALRLQREAVVKIGFIGMGNMGAPMAMALLKAGHELKVFNRTAAKAEPLARAGATVARTPRETVDGVDVAVTMLANDAAMRDTWFGSPGDAAIDALPSGAVHMCTSTISVALAKELEREHESRGQRYVAAPVLGRPDAAAARKLWVILGGAAGNIDRCRPIVDAIGRGSSIAGDQPWQANVTKIGANFMLASMLETMGEALALVRKSDMDAHAFIEVIDALFASPVYANYGRLAVDRAFMPAGFRLTLGLKDVGLALAAGLDAAVAMPIAAVVRDQYLIAMANGLADADWSAISDVASRNAGVTSD